MNSTSLERVPYRDRFRIAGKDVLTTGDVGIALHISSRTVGTRLDDGSIPKGRRVPNSPDRRLEKKFLEKEMEEAGLETDWLQYSVIHVGKYPPRLKDKNIRRIRCSSLFETSMLMADNCVIGITVDHDDLPLDRVDPVRESIREACQKRGYPVPSFEITGKRKTQAASNGHMNGVAHETMNGHGSKAIDTLCKSTTERLEDWML